MSKIDGLIRELCPEGVANKELGDILRRIEGSNRKIVKSKIQSSGKYPVYTQGASQIPDGYSDDDETVIKDVPVILYGDHTNVLKWIDHDFIAGADGVKLVKSSGESGLEDRFLYHCLKNKIKEVPDGYARHFAKLRKLTIPIPPLEVQKEIVNILDKFTQLEAELSAELSARRKQYEYYRNQLLTFDESRERVKWLELGEVCKISRGRVMSKDYLTDNAGEFPVYSSQTANNGIFGCINSYDYDFESITWTTDGANAGSVFYHNDEKFSITNVCGLVRVRSDILSTRYLYYALQILTKPHVSAGMGNPKLMSNVISKIKVPIPPIEEQNRIASILDNFDLLVNGISEGLPSELKARRQQYEYYRTKLLTFQELPA